MQVVVIETTDTPHLSSSREMMEEEEKLREDDGLPK